MASAALKAEEPIGEGTMIHGEEPQARDFEAEAKEHGWSPEEDFKGDKARWVDAETFMKRADEMMPLLKAQNARLKRDYEALRKDLRRATTHFEGAEKRAYDRALSDLEQKHTQAVEAGDVVAANAAVKEMRNLAPTEETPRHTKEEAQDALDAFREEHSWYDRANLANASELDINARVYFDRMIDRNIARTAEMAPADFFQMITDMTLEKYPALRDKPPRTKPASAVEGGLTGRPRGSSKSWENLPDEAKRQFGKFINRGILGVKATGDKDKDMAASRAYYARTFDWEGYQA